MSATVSETFSAVVMVGSSCCCSPLFFAFCFWPLLPDSATVLIRDENSFIAQEATSPPTTPAAAPFHTEGLRRLFLQLYSMIHLKGRVRDQWIGANPGGALLAPRIACSEHHVRENHACGVTISGRLANGRSLRAADLYVRW